MPAANDSKKKKQRRRSKAVVFQSLEATQRETHTHTHAHTHTHTRKQTTCHDRKLGFERQEKSQCKRTRGAGAGTRIQISGDVGKGLVLMLALFECRWRPASCGLHNALTSVPPPFLPLFPLSPPNRMLPLCCALQDNVNVRDAFAHIVRLLRRDEAPGDGKKKKCTIM